MKAIAHCFCLFCRKDFTEEKIVRNQQEADGFRNWVELNHIECPDCRRERLAAEANEIAEKIIRAYNLPEITGVSEKQIAYARDLRSKHLARKKDLVASYVGQRKAECCVVLHRRRAPYNRLPDRKILKVGEIVDTPNPIRALRAETGLTQSAFGAALNIPRRTIQSWEMGERECPAYVIDLIAYRVRHDNNLRYKEQPEKPEA